MFIYSACACLTLDYQPTPAASIQQTEALLQSVVYLCISLATEGPLQQEATVVF